VSYRLDTGPGILAQHSGSLQPIQDELDCKGDIIRVAFLVLSIPSQVKVYRVFGDFGYSVFNRAKPDSVCLCLFDFCSGVTVGIGLRYKLV